MRRSQKSFWWTCPTNAKSSWRTSVRSAPTSTYFTRFQSDQCPWNKPNTWRAFLFLSVHTARKNWVFSSTSQQQDNMDITRLTLVLERKSLLVDNLTPLMLLDAETFHKLKRLSWTLMTWSRWAPPNNYLTILPKRVFNTEKKALAFPKFFSWWKTVTSGRRVFRFYVSDKFTFKKYGPTLVITKMTFKLFESLSWHQSREFCRESAVTSLQVCTQLSHNRPNVTFTRCLNIIQWSTHERTKLVNLELIKFSTRLSGRHLTLSYKQ